MLNLSSKKFQEKAMASDSEWELIDREEEDRPILGVLIPSVGFLPFGKQEDSSDGVIPGHGSAVPASFTVLSSSVGLVLSRGPWSAYHVVDTLSGARHHLPRPSRAHRSDTPSVVIRRGADFAVVCAVADPHSADGVYTFDSYSSSSGRWSHADEEKIAIGAVDPDSGVAAAGSAYWRTSSPSPMVVGYDPSSCRVRILTPPAGAWASKDRWQLGSARGRLCCVVLTESSDALAYALEGSTDKWRLVGSMGLAWWPSAVPARFESCSATGVQVVLAAEGNVVVADLERERIVSTAGLLQETAAAAAKKMVPIVGNPLAEEYVEVLGSASVSD
ncbi:proline-rich receptor-like protein kinase PERK8 [Iris pallida]|uniref:Proline-rich receptor-like protein kinase PERK8 n=1 Tax=Iris pallida TaxID=29817 RepID=A0AAX6GHT8_IRIPA|nr:proline-rich receptor-like protein kinase PERK8 [Iris pallida]